MTCRTMVMGVLNVTPDSFSDGGRYDRVELAVERALQLRAQGADLIDVGGESTRPGATPVSHIDEQQRVLPVVEALVAHRLSVSVDTLHATTAAACAAAGVHYINDVSGGTHDPEMLSTVARANQQFGTQYILGHWRGVPDAAEQNSEYADVVTEVRNSLTVQRDAAVAAGISAIDIVLDPGLGFDKTPAQCWKLLEHLPELAQSGQRLLIGASRKRMLAELLRELPQGEGDGTPEHRDLMTAVVTAFASRAEIWGVRVHDVPGSVQARAVAHMWPAQLTRNAPHVRTVEDRVSLTGLEVFAHHGVFDFERTNGQKFLIDANLTLDLSVAAHGDALHETVHYGELADAIVKAVETDPVDLIETVAERVAAVALGFRATRVARITVHKPDAPINHKFVDVSVTVVRQREGIIE